MFMLTRLWMPLSVHADKAMDAFWCLCFQGNVCLFVFMLSRQLLPFGVHAFSTMDKTLSLQSVLS